MKRSSSSEGTSQEFFFGTGCKQYLLVSVVAGFCTCQPARSWPWVWLWHREGFALRTSIDCSNSVVLSVLVMGHVSVPSLFGDKIYHMLDNKPVVGFAKLLRTALYLPLPHLTLNLSALSAQLILNNTLCALKSET